MLSQKEAPSVSKIANLVWISVQFSFVDYVWLLPGCFLLCTSSSKRKHPGSTYNYLIMAGNLHQLDTFLESTHGCFLGAFFCDIINRSYCTYFYPWTIPIDLNSHLILFKDLGQDCYSTHLLRYVHKERNSVFICPLTPNKCWVRKKGFRNVLLINSWVM